MIRQTPIVSPKALVIASGKKGVAMSVYLLIR